MVKEKHTHFLFFKYFNRMDEFNNHIMDPEYSNSQPNTNLVENETNSVANDKTIASENKLQQQEPQQEQCAQIDYGNAVDTAAIQIETNNVCNEQNVNFSAETSKSLPPPMVELPSTNVAEQLQQTQTADASKHENFESAVSNEKTDVQTNDQSPSQENNDKSNVAIDDSTVGETDSGGDGTVKTHLEIDDVVDDAEGLIVPDNDVNNLVKEDEEIDLNQCRVCLSTENLVDIFKYEQKNVLRICDLIMKLCASIKISERDHLPHLVCAGCVERIEAAYELKLQCEDTEKLLRSKLKRCKRTRRDRSEYVIIDCAPGDSPSDSDDDDNKDDDEFHLSEVTEASEPDSDMSYESKNKRSQTRRTRRKPPAKRKPAAPAYQPPKKSKQKSGVVYIKAVESDDDVPVAQRRTKKSKPKRTSDGFDYTCDTCAKICDSPEALIQHQRLHVEEKCPICAKSFRQRSALMQHVQKHKDDEERICGQCHKEFPSKMECKRHMQTVHTEVFPCTKCKRQFTSKIRLDKHKCTNENVKRKFDTEYTSNSGRDLFKSVAPLTTTYWSDSFSD